MCSFHLVLLQLSVLNVWHVTHVFFCRRSLWHKAKKCHLTPGQTELKVCRIHIFIPGSLVQLRYLSWMFLCLFLYVCDLIAHLQVDFPLPIVACNLMIEYADFYENFQVHFWVFFPIKCLSFVSTLVRNTDLLMEETSLLLCVCLSCRPRLKLCSALVVVLLWMLILEFAATVERMSTSATSAGLFFCFFCLQDGPFIRSNVKVSFIHIA